MYNFDIDVIFEHHIRYINTFMWPKSAKYSPINIDDLSKCKCIIFMLNKCILYLKYEVFQEKTIEKHWIQLQ